MAKPKTKKKRLSGKAWAAIIGVLLLLGAGSRAGRDTTAAEPKRAAVAVSSSESPRPTGTPFQTSTPIHTATPYRIHGWDPQTAVYVSRNGVIHFKPDCSGMKNYTEMTLEAADAAGYKICEHCG